MGQEEGIATVSTSVICSVVENRQADFYHRRFFIWRH
jgi:hypothetical protein